MFNLSATELGALKRLSTPTKIQDFLNTLAINFEKTGETLMSPREVLRTKRAHCIEAALLAATALWFHGERPLLMDLRSLPHDFDHVVTLYKKGKYWGAISKSNHAVLRFRDPIYRSPRELAMSYFHEYFLNANGQKTLREHSLPFSIKRFGKDWITSSDNLWYIAEALDDSPHARIVPRGYERSLRPADKLERKAGEIIEWHK
jgi:hypothetical protein